MRGARWDACSGSCDLDAAPARDSVGYLDAARFQWVDLKSWLVSVSCFFWLAFGAAVQRLLRGRRRPRVFIHTLEECDSSGICQPAH